ILGSEKTLVSSKRQFERARSGTHIIFDVGMNNGDDSKHYLSKGYQVVAIEANPILVERGRARLQKEIAAGQILIECVGIVDQPRHNSRFPDFGNDNMFSRAAKRACWYADRFKNRFSRVPFARGCSGPFGEETPGTWQTFEEVAYNWLALHFGHHKRGTLN